MNNNEKVAIITGSSQGLGASVAKKLAENNINVVINYYSNKNLALEVEKFCISKNVKTLCIKADISTDSGCKKLVDETINLFGKIDILVNNAGTTKFASHSKLDELSSEDFSNIYRLNVIGAYQMIKNVEPYMKKNGFGSIVNVSSIFNLEYLAIPLPINTGISDSS